MQGSLQPVFCISFLQQFHRSSTCTQEHPSFAQFDMHDQHFGYPCCKSMKYFINPETWQWPSHRSRNCLGEEDTVFRCTAAWFVHNNKTRTNNIQLEKYGKRKNSLLKSDKELCIISSIVLNMPTLLTSTNPMYSLGHILQAFLLLLQNTKKIKLFSKNILSPLHTLRVLNVVFLTAPLNTDQTFSGQSLDKVLIL